MSNKLVCSAETQHRALKLRIYPSHDQEILINKTFGCWWSIRRSRKFDW
ncbi:MAG: helix-turn-helix domain-containing protein [Candidatus Riflebacteria bacterium]|nr:helix-turn-helix domain-containing protein [Candidatus Riflebacteria bacterium]